MPYSSKQSKIQALVIKYLMEFGTLDILLPDGITLEIGITERDGKGDIVKSDDYCYVRAQREDRVTLLDSYNAGLTFDPEGANMLVDDSETDEVGHVYRHLDVV